MFKKDEYVVHPFAGICKIREIEDIKMEQITRSCYIVQPLSNEKLVIKIPVNSNKSNLRPVISKQKAIEVIDSFHDGSDSESLSGRYIYKANMPVIESGDVIEIAKISKSLMEKKYRQKQIQKKLSIDEEKLLVLTQKLLFTEIGYVMNVSNEEIENCIVDKMKER